MGKEKEVYTDTHTFKSTENVSVNIKNNFEIKMRKLYTEYGKKRVLLHKKGCQTKIIQAMITDDRKVKPFYIIRSNEKNNASN